MSNLAEQTFTAVVAWDHQGFGFEGEITAVPTVRARAPTVIELMSRLGVDLYRWLSENGMPPGGKDLEITAVRVDG